MAGFTKRFELSRAFEVGWDGIKKHEVEMMMGDERINNPRVYPRFINRYTVEFGYI